MSEIQTDNTPVARVPRRGFAARARHDLVYSLLIPLEGYTLLLPNTAVAEVLNYSRPDAALAAPEWLLGMLLWRERRVPMISFEAACGGRPGPATRRSRIVVLNTLGGNPDLPYIAVMTQGIPHLRALGEESVEREEGEASASVACRVRLDGSQLALIPDIDELERRVARLQGRG